MKNILSGMMKNVLKTSYIALFLLVLPFSGAHSQADQWELLGERQMNFKIDRDALPITPGKRPFSAIKIVVEGIALNMPKCIIHFEKGGTQEVPLKHSFGPQSTSRTIELKGNKKMIESIEFWYDTKGLLARRATVKVFGKH